MLILLHDSRGNELIVNTDIVTMVKEQWNPVRQRMEWIKSEDTKYE